MKCWILIAASVASLVGCCPPSMIDVAAIEGSVNRIADRHDAYVNADASLTPAERSTYLRTSELLRKVIENAKKPQSGGRVSVSETINHLNVRSAIDRGSLHRTPTIVSIPTR